MDSVFHFTNGGVTLVSWKSFPISIKHFGGMRFSGDDLVEYKIVEQKEANTSYAYLEISQDMKTGILFDKEPIFNSNSERYESDGLKVSVEIVIHDDTDFEVPKNRLLILQTIRWKNPANCRIFYYQNLHILVLFHFFIYKFQLNSCLFKHFLTFRPRMIFFFAHNSFDSTIDYHHSTCPTWRHLAIQCSSF